MEKKKNNKKLFAIIAASALAFVLTVALSVSITLAYFGGKTDASANLTMGGSVEVNKKQTAAATLEKLIPGQKMDMDISVDVTSSSTQDAYLVAIISIDAKTGADGEITNATVKNGLLGLITADTTKWFAAGTATGDVAGNVYVYGASDKATKISASATATNISLASASVQVPAEWNNDYADLKLTATVTYVAVQTPVNADGALVPTPTAEQMKTVVETVGGFTWNQA